MRLEGGTGTAPAVQQAGPLVRGVQGLLLVELLLFGVSTLPGIRGSEGFDPLLDGWLQGSAYVLTAVLATLRPMLGRADRAVWGWIAGGLCLRALAFVTYLAVVRRQDPQPYPSLADAGWLAMSVLLVVGLVGMVRRRSTGLTLTLVLDGVVGAFATAGLAVGLLWSTLEKLTAAGIPTDALVTNLAYPALDLGLLVVLLGVLVAYAWRPPRELWWLAAGVAGFAVVDSVFLYQSAAGTFRPGSPIAALSLLSTALVAWSGFVGSGPDVSTQRLRHAPGLLLPTVSACVCIGVLVYGTRQDVPASAVALATLGLLVAVVRTAVTFRDVQALTEARRAAQASARLAAVVQASHEAICTVDLTGVVTSWNPAAERVFDQPSAEVLGHPLREVAWPADDGRYDDVVGGTLRGRRSQAVEVVSTAPDGSQVVRLWSGDPVQGEDDSVVGAAFTVKDVTAERAAEAVAEGMRERVQHVQRLESLGQLAGGIAHDFNNLLGALTLTAEVQRNALPEASPARGESERILGIARRATALVRQLLVFARNDVAHRETVDLNRLVVEVDGLLGRTLGENIDRVIRLDPVPCLVEADPSQLEQVVLNLAINARDAMPAGGRLTVTTRRLERDDGEHVLLAVSDTGAGMEPATAERAFDPFFTTKPRGSGTGLGLAVVFGVARGCGGDAWIESTPGRGTSVQVLLPLMPDGRLPAPVPTPAATGRRSGTVVLVEDETDLRSAVRQVLSAAGYDVHAYPDAVAALESAPGWPAAPDLLLTDVLLPGLTGPELATRLRERHPQLRVVLMSGYTDGSLAHAGVAVVEDVLEKPFGTADLLSRLDRELGT